MARFKVFVLEPPRRWTDAQRALVRGAAMKGTEPLVEAFISGTDRDPLMLWQGDNPSRATTLWEEGHRAGITVVIYDHSTAWDRLKDRLSALRQSAPRAPAERSEAPQEPSPAGPRAGEQAPQLRDPGALALGARGRATLLGIALFAAVLALAFVGMSGARDEARTTPDASSEALPGAGGAGGSRGLPSVAGAGGDAPVGNTPANGDAMGNGEGAQTSPQGSSSRIDASTSPSRSSEGEGASVIALLGAFALGFALAWGAGLVVPSRVPRAHLRGARQVVLGACSMILVAASLSWGIATFVTRSRAASPPPSSSPSPPSIAPRAASAPRAGAAEDGDAEARARGPFARFLARRRQSRRPRTRSLRELIASWRQERTPPEPRDRADAATPDAGSATPGHAEGGHRAHRRRRRHRDTPRDAHRGPRRSSDAAVITEDAAGSAVPSASAAPPSGDAAAPSGDTAEPSGNTAEPSGNTAEPSGNTAEPSGSAGAATPNTVIPSGDTSAPSADTLASSGNTAEPSGNTGARSASARRAAVTAARPRALPEERRPPRPPLALSLLLGVLCGVLSSPRWRSVAREEDA